MRNWIKYLIVTIIVALLTNGGQLYFWNHYIDKMKTDYESEIQILSSTLEDIGKLKYVYSVRTETKPGKEINLEDLVKVKVPESIINGSYAQEPEDLLGKYYKVSISPGTLITDDLLMKEEMDDTIRETDLIADTWSVGLEIGDYIDYEITYPYGEKYIVLSHIRVEAINEKTIKTYLTSVQRHIYNGALVDYFLQKENGATVNLVKYVEPGVQKPSEVSYSVPDNILSVITEDPNVIEKINTNLNTQKRDIIEKGINLVSEFDSSNLSSGRSKIVSDINGAGKEYETILEKRLEEEKKEAERAAYEQKKNEEQQNTQDGQNSEKGMMK
ncbi:SAF domain-containing protein [Vallitalea guaymasensis]|uniref:SAF domain-containing protein n=1 Tax=Vallitalea guaymasensis TaxID=1185412 RepID=UPI000DE26EAA|nr:SAF domain-containing protein [Vallitalea guaymasensis]